MNQSPAARHPVVGVPRHPRAIAAMLCSSISGVYMYGNHPVAYRAARRHRPRPLRPGHPDRQPGSAPASGSGSRRPNVVKRPLELDVVFRPESMQDLERFVGPHPRARLPAPPHASNSLANSPPTPTTEMEPPTRNEIERAATCFASSGGGYKGTSVIVLISLMRDVAPRGGGEGDEPVADGDRRRRRAHRSRRNRTRGLPRGRASSATLSRRPQPYSELDCHFSPPHYVVFRVRQRSPRRNQRPVSAASASLPDATNPPFTSTCRRSPSSTSICA